MRLKKWGTIMMSGVLVFGLLPFSASAADQGDSETDSGKYSKKDEAIYGNLDASGALENMYVVNTFHVTKPGEIIDHGNYTNVRNLSNLTDIKQTDNNQIHVQAKDDDEFYYQGDMANKALPWHIDITYMLDGKKVAPKDLAGKDGSLKIQIKTSANDDADPIFFKNYMLQISLTLGPDVSTNIQAPDGTKAAAGKDTKVTFTNMPEKEETFIVSANVSDFEMDPINISATPASMPIDDPDLGDVKGKMASLSDGIGDINNSVRDLNNGMAKLNTNATKLSNGSSDYLHGINKLDQSSSKLVNGSAKIRNALQSVNQSVQDAPDKAPDLGNLKQLPANIHKLADNLRKSADQLDTLKKNYSSAYSQVDNAIGSIPDDDLSKDLKKLRQNENVDDAVVDRLQKMYQAAQNAKDTYQNVQKAFGSVTEQLNQTSKQTRNMADNIDNTADKIDNGIGQMDQLDALGQLQDGIADMVSQYQSFHNGLVDYTDSVGKLANSYQDINTGIDGLADGTSQLDNGTSKLEDGTEKLHDKTSDLPGEMQDKVDNMVDEYDASDFEPQSFVSDKNNKVDVVQFTLSTEPIEVAESDEKDESKDKQKSLWDRFMDLF